MLVRLTGGLGNQLFQWAFGRTTSLKKGWPLQFHWSKSCFDYALDKYAMDIELAEPSQNSLTFDETTFRYDPTIEGLPDGYYRGYWQSEKYFDHELVRRELILKQVPGSLTVKLGEYLARHNSVFIHVRRGDYLQAADYHGLLGTDYYNSAADYISKHVPGAEFYVFSDDLEWCREHLSGKFKILGFPGSSHDDELYLMSRCEHAIIANSTFSWWGAWLGDADPEDRIVIAPQRWFGEASGVDGTDIVPERWVRI